MPALLKRLFSAAAKADGQAGVLVAHATGVAPDALQAGLPDTAIIEASSPQRRQRPPNHPRTQLAEILGAKLLHDWLQNRHQVLFPLTLNVRTLTQEQAHCLAQMAAVAVLADGQAGIARRADLRRFLASVKAEDAILAGYDAALEHAPSLDVVVANTERLELGAYAFIVSVVATDQREAAGRAFTTYLAARLRLPDTIVNSARRRYRR